MNRKVLGIAGLAGALAWACGEPAAGPKAAIAPSFDRGGVPGWRRMCFDATATPVKFGANWQLTDPNGAPNANAPTVDQVALVASEINGTCGVRVGTGTLGSPLDVTVLDSRGTATVSSTITRQLIDAGAVAIVGGGGAVTASPAAQVAVESNTPMGTNQTGGDGTSGCTSAELTDPTVVKSATPTAAPGQCWDNHGLVFRTRSTGYGGGVVGGRYARDTYLALTTAALIYRAEDPTLITHVGLRDGFGALGGTVLAQQGFTPAITVDGFKTLLRTVTTGNPRIILGTIVGLRLKLLMQAYVELRDDLTWTDKPANFNTLRFLFVSTLSSTNYGDLGASALAALVNQVEFIEDSWDPNSIAFKHWLALYQAFRPDAAPPSSPFFMSAYDATFVMALAVTATGTTDPGEVAAKFSEVANPPGHVICPGQWRKAFRFLAQGKDINYEGALSPVDLDERGNATGVVSAVFNVQSIGTSMLTRRLGSGYQPACEYDEEEG